ncbi:MAG: metallopeptidase family protein [Candidatus Eisenbacteria bacterium]|uniref:Metallopeptidase family protein n=1 Tax=Eiseniibacteriota bacterium TaxID=2212470 RepID=A0A9D6L888_UNCEI|nr:metallopeptidase family protein [Candidatus Eisenbacteria bacterium]MBI3540406.1 metallopeptidase family protein [Candidatus Eisenbacteria bacterium]
MSYETLDETEWSSVDAVWDLLDEGKVDEARDAIDGLLRHRPGHPDLRIVDASVALDEGDAERALIALQGAERSADPSLFFHLRAFAQYELAALEPAREDAHRALAVHPDLPETHALLARTLEMLGDADGAEEHARIACDLDPDRFPMPLEVSDAEFDALVEASLLELPAEVRRHLDELPVLVEPLPSRGMLTAEKPAVSPDVLGLFVGRHLMERSHSDLPAMPGAIYLFRKNLLRACADRDELAEEVRTTVRHEVGHLIGLDEDEIERWGLA